ncbi:hypothetical protein A2291_00960 [candidate division WOR-1 bacterium RIFOXYB2_FULL_42_35]|uniref:Cell division protein FtsL n=1 Tax=candidate division WOR-1 bacterium RIFOXYC2_FULL_41_25 TaxID=1802586 RepID=A0A1F4TLJ4_UNCSA|nr:MAG: hypothetical protein A2247_05945 [candidate division WOR-1 bacterium RIFOXYA2_FULL_41_14]OGC23624.1 MAG: hypothetical protein A2291_00960 [candidate division WOR-1 bacterium RIFOXYB2_FULL_42_35]OGC33588.1 MAG: hypothetical protein A2462_02775 [candidate division WOR-1 bacterium RIFOXYC2_FULL_41_25]OGC41754.1 MAG: hypothetical protein A2548_03330 [candidate division WOR-1 bacterium RIFOXYD2_FULL_41_8]
MKKQFRRAVFILVILVILAGIHLSIYTQNISLKYKLSGVKIKLAEIVSQRRLLDSQVAKKENLAYVEKVAKEKLAMVYPKKINYIETAKDSADPSD